MEFLGGYKTYIVAAVLIVVALLKIFGIVVPGFETIDPVAQITTALGLIFGRFGATQDVQKALK